MVHIRQGRVGGLLRIEVAGDVIDESLRLPPLHPNAIAAAFEPITRVTIKCRDVTRVNSSGVRAWARLFEEFRRTGVPLTLTECSSAMVGALNWVSRFAEGVAIDSLALPYFCTPCRRELFGFCRVEKLEKYRFRPPGVRCPHCAGFAQFDEHPEDYFFCLTR